LQRQRVAGLEERIRGLTQLAREALHEEREDLARLAIHRRHVAELGLEQSAGQSDSLDRIERLVEASLRELTAILAAPASAATELRLELDSAIEIELRELLSQERQER
jgi:hypothetical protein